MVTLRILPRFHATPEVRSLPSTGITRLHRYYEPLRLPGRPGLTLAGVRLGLRPHRQDLPCCVDLLVQTCRRHYPGGTVGGIRLLPGNPRQRPSPSNCWVGSHIGLFEACTAFTPHYGLPARGAAKRPFPSKASTLPLPPALLRLLLVGATVAREELHLLKIDTFARRTIRPDPSL